MISRASSLAVLAAVALLVGLGVAEAREAGPARSRPTAEGRAVQLDAAVSRTARASTLPEDFETGYTIGDPVAGQNGWTSDWPANTAIVQPGIDNVSARHASDGTTASGYELLSPVFTETRVLGVDLRLTGGDSAYHVIPAESGGGHFHTRIAFAPTGEILVARPEAGCLLFELVATGWTWTPGAVFRLVVETPDDGRLLVFLDGEPIFEDVSYPSACVGGPAAMDRLLVWAANEGSGDLDGTGDTLTVDDISADRSEPVPAIAVPVLDSVGLAILSLVLGLAGSAFLQGRASA